MQNKKILIIGFVWPEPSSTAAGNRMAQLLHFFLDNEFEITFASTANETPRSLNLDKLGVQKATILLNHPSFDTFISDLNPGVVLFDRFLTEEQFGWRVAENVPNALRILNTEDLHSLRTTRELAFKKGCEFTNTHWLQDDITKREVASIYRCDLSLIVSTYEMELLTRVLKIDEELLLHLPFLLNNIDTNTEWPSYEERQDFICIGNGKHSPNIDAIRWLNAEIWPLIRKELPKTNLYIYGPYLPQQILEMNKPNKGFIVAGWVEDAHEVMAKSRINLAPLRFGAGIKGKLTDAMQNGTPSVTTDIGAEGMHNGHDWPGAITNNAEDFAYKAVQLYKDKMLWEQKQQNGIKIINEFYDKKTLSTRFKSKIVEIQDNLMEYRLNNFTGALLMHQTINATKYMSKWITAKNRS